MKLNSRRQSIMNLLMEAGTVTVEELSTRFGVSEMTIHRDLNDLEGDGLLRRIRGGASIEPNNQFEVDFRFRQRLAAKEKDRIAKAAADQIESGQTVIIDDGSTAGGVARYIADKQPLTVITSNLAVIELLAGKEGITLITLGGQYSKKFHGFFGLLTEEALRSLRADIAFMSASSVYGTSAFHREQESVQAKRLMMRASERTFLLVDHGKFGKRALQFLCELDEFTGVLTGSKPDEGSLESLRSAGIPITVVAE
ncbi:DeoR/GlpR family DNA-binding transcription regulator [Pararhizobium sp. A13]|uniref:DeoR/GlpR family DNA-binding transcription regulator n=1 Tax=Pararhizobium sp. A13 TaxID=3133975 RepID=UPI00311AC6BD